MPNLFAYSTSCRIFEEGGDKLHIYDWDVGRILCGRHLTGSIVQEMTPEWLSRIEDGHVCRQCQARARRILGCFEK